jgi:hypothetical protein
VRTSTQTADPWTERSQHTLRTTKWCGHVTINVCMARQYALLKQARGLAVGLGCSSRVSCLAAALCMEHVAAGCHNRRCALAGCHNIRCALAIQGLYLHVDACAHQHKSAHELAENSKGWAPRS